MSPARSSRSCEAISPSGPRSAVPVAANDNEFAAISSPDTIGNLTQRTDAHTGAGNWSTEYFCCDDLNRVTHSNLNTNSTNCTGTGPGHMGASYDATGNMLTHTGLTYAYRAGKMLTVVLAGERKQCIHLIINSARTINGKSQPSKNARQTSHSNRDIGWPVEYCYVILLRFGFCAFTPCSNPCYRECRSVE